MIERTSGLSEPLKGVSVAAAGTTYTYFGLPMSDWVGLFTIMYLVVQTIANVPKFLRVLRNVLQGKGWTDE